VVVHLPGGDDRRLAHVEQLAARGGDPDRFRTIVVDVRERHYQKRSLVALLDQRAWPA
jgi:hypothetical protein